MLNLITFNRWWDTGKVDEVYLKPYRRKLFYNLQRFLDVRQILLIYGLRRVGKTTLMYQLIDYLLKSGVNRKHILYFSFDEKIVSLDDLFKEYSEFVLGKDLLKAGRIFVFLDEIQKLGDWQNRLKIFYDLYPNIKFIISGSAGLQISKGTKESLAGRVYEFILPLLNFSEYLEFLGEKVELHDPFNIKEIKEIYLKKERIVPLLNHYLKTGGFIEIATEEDDLKIKEYSKSILERVIFADIPMSFKIKEPYLLMRILELVASNPGFLLDYSKLSQIFNKDQRVIANYVFYLKYALLVKVLYNFSGSKFSLERKLKKIYLASTNFIYQFFPEKFNQSDFIGKIIENAVSVFSDTAFFWRERGKEVDIVLNSRIPVEVKYKEKIFKEDLKGILRFSKKFKIHKAILLTRDEIKKEKINSLLIYSIPVWIYFLKN